MLDQSSSSGDGEPDGVHDQSEDCLSIGGAESCRSGSSWQNYGSIYISSKPVSRCSSQASLASRSGVAAAAEVETMLKEEQQRRTRLQLYVFTSRCIAHPVFTRYPTDVTHRQTKATEAQLATIKKSFETYLSGKSDIVADEAFTGAVEAYYQVFLGSEQLKALVDRGAVTLKDFREVFKKNIERRVGQLPDIEGVRKESIISSWLHKFDKLVTGGQVNEHGRIVGFITDATEVLPTKEQLYELLQSILEVKKYEHQILYNALQVRLSASYS